VEALDLLGIADHPALELLNSTSDATGEHLDVLTDGDGLLAWLTSSGLLDPDRAQQLASQFERADLDDATGEARALRDEVRAAVQGWATNPAPLSQTLLERLNDLLAREHRHAVVLAQPELAVTDVGHWSSAAALLALPARALADLFVNGDPTLVRGCEGRSCTLWFYDRTKNHRRRWCSMAGCGNREKARAFKARHTGSVPDG